MRTHVCGVGSSACKLIVPTRRHHVDKNALALECVALEPTACAIELLLPRDLCFSTLRPGLRVARPLPAPTIEAARERVPIINCA